MTQSKWAELVEEFRSVVAGKRTWGDALGPPIAFVLVNLTFGIWPAIACAGGLALSITVIRLVRRHSLRFALGGLGGVSLASLLALGLARGEGYFLPGMINGAAISVTCLVSVIARRPLVAWTSFLTRRWPLNWYWHARVRPAYTEVTLLWFAFFSSRLALQWILFQRSATRALGTLSLILGWPSIAILLAGSYLYGLWRLRHLHGPSIEEFREGAPPPWRGQQRGF